MTRSSGKSSGLRAKDKSKMGTKCGFNYEDDEEVTEMPRTENLKEAARADKIAKEAWAKVMAHRKASALTAAPETAAPETATAPTPAPENTTVPTPVLETAATLAPAPAIH